MYKSPDYLFDLDIMKFIKERNAMLVQFLSGISGLCLDEECSKVLFAFSSTIEMIYQLRNFNLVLPRCFMSNLVQSCVSGSKTVAAVNGKIFPGGG